MRFIIIGLSIIFFTLSAIITFKALEFPDTEASYQAKQKDVSSELNTVIKKLAEDQATNRAIVADLRATITQLEDKLETKQTALETIKTTKIESKPRTLSILSGWTFRPGKSTLNDVALSTIENFVGDILAEKDSRILIEGHTDNIPTGKPTDNMDLSLRRAKAIANILISHGVASDRISAIGYGDTRPIDFSNTEEGRAKNRRVEVKLIPKDSQEGKS